MTSELNIFQKRDKFIIHPKFHPPSNMLKTCCICYESHPKLHFISCDFCKEGSLCGGCIYRIEETNKSIIVNCPICKNLLINYSLHNIILRALTDEWGIRKKNVLFKKWLNYYNNTVIKLCPWDYVYRKGEQCMCLDCFCTRLDEKVYGRWRRFVAQLITKHK